MEIYISLIDNWPDQIFFYITTFENLSFKSVSACMGGLGIIWSRFSNNSVVMCESRYIFSNQNFKNKRWCWLKIPTSIFVAYIYKCLPRMHRSSMKSSAAVIDFDFSGSENRPQSKLIFCQFLTPSMYSI